MSKFKVGDRVYSLRGGWGKITESINKGDYRFMVNFDNRGRMPITKDGGFNNKIQSVFHSASECLDYMRKL